MTKIKICGLSRPEDIRYVNEAQPDYCGFVVGVPKSPRNITQKQLRELKRGLRKSIQAVGVFVDGDPELIAQLLNEGVIDAAQLHGQEDEVYIRKLRGKTDGVLIKAFSVTAPEDLEKANQSSADLILLDNGKGGTGQSFDREILRAVPDMRDYFLAGGVGVPDIPDLVRAYRPWAVDMSSFVETDGKKDREKIMAAVAAVRSCRL